MITVYKTRNCAYCPMVTRFLKHKGAKFQEVYVDDDPDTRARLHAKTGLMTVPVTTDGENYIVGWQPAKLASLL